MKMRYIFFMLILLSAHNGLIAQSSIKWQQTFDGLAVPPGWQVIDADKSGSGLTLVSSLLTGSGTEILPQAGQGFWTSNLENANLAGIIDEWLVSPRLSVIYAGDSLYFWAGAVGGLFDDSLRIKISTTNSKPASFKHTLGTIKVDGPAGSWHRYGFDLSAFDSLDIYFAINYYIKDGGPGGQHSDQIWLDHTLISGDPGTLNNPPSMSYLQAPENQSVVDINQSSVDFRWSASHDQDNQDIRYTLSIVNVFPILEFTGIADSSFSLEWQDRLNQPATYRWTITITDGLSTIASTDTFTFRLADPTAVYSDQNPAPGKYILNRNYPNPFNPVTKINYQLPVKNYVELNIFNTLGQKVETLVSGEQPAGTYSLEWDASTFPSGVYIYQIKAKSDQGLFQQQYKMLLIK